MTTLILTLRQSWRSYLELTKPKVVAMITFTAMVGMFLSVPGAVPWEILIFASLGVALASGSAAAINHLVDRHLDAVMARTRDRPLPSGHLDPWQVLAFATVLALLSALLLLQFANALTLAITFAALFGYAVVYTLYLKHATPQNIVIGGAAGAAPPLIGWVAVTGQVDPGALILFLIVFIWTPPHFWALAIHRREDYARAGLPMLPVTHGVPFTRLNVWLYSLLLGAITMMPFVIGMSGVTYLLGAAVLNARFLHLAWQLWYREDDSRAMPLFGYSIVYLFALFAVLMVDHYILIALH